MAYIRSLEPRPSSARFFLQGCEIKSGRGRLGFKASKSLLTSKAASTMLGNTSAH